MYLNKLMYLLFVYQKRPQDSKITKLIIVKEVQILFITSPKYEYVKLIEKKNYHSFIMERNFNFKYIYNYMYINLYNVQVR